jgi:putative ubiquitin-RnfH superfamily antitoxin RatB of RatAB toxin-antitoxin module
MAKVSEPTIEVEIVYALPHEQARQTLRVPVGASIAQAIAQAGVMQRYPELAQGCTTVGIFGRRADLTAVVREFDRIEIYRPLIADPKQSRRTRAQRVAKAPR